MLPVLLAAATEIPRAAAAAVATAVASPNAKATTIQVPVNPNVDFGYLHKSPLALHFGWLTHTFAALFLIFAVLLVALLAIQTTKQEGLSGTIGGRVDSNYRGRLGMEGQIARVTSYVAIGFMVFATIVSIAGI